MLSRVLATGLFCLTALSPAFADEVPVEEQQPTTTAVQEDAKAFVFAPEADELVSKVDVLAELAVRLEEQVSNPG